MGHAKQNRKLGKTWKRALLSGRKVRGDARVLVTEWGALLEIEADLSERFEGAHDDDALIYHEEPVYHADDWKSAGSPSFAIDRDGDLRRHNGRHCYGKSIPFRVGTAADLWDWPDTSGVLLAERGEEIIFEGVSI
jgi:hypothetical protein